MFRWEGQGISHDWGGRRVFQDISFTLEAGECLWVQGKNGSGKTTFLQGILYGTSFLTRGQVRFGVQTASSSVGSSWNWYEKEASWEWYHYCPTQLLCAEEQTVAQCLSSLGEEEREEALSWFGTYELWKDQRLGQLSTGQRRKVL